MKTKPGRRTEHPEGPGRRPAADEHDSAQEEPGNTAPLTEIGGRKGPDPTRFGDWEKDGRCIDF